MGCESWPGPEKLESWAWLAQSPQQDLRLFPWSPGEALEAPEGWGCAF